MNSVLRTIGIMAIVVCASVCAFACECAQVSQEQSLAASDAVFIGKVMPVDADSSFSSQNTTFEVRGVIKGDISNADQVVLSRSTIDSGVPFFPGGVYLVYARKNDDGTYSAPACLGTKPLMMRRAFLTGRSWSGGDFHGGRRGFLEIAVATIAWVGTFLLIGTVLSLLRKRFS